MNRLKLITCYVSSRHIYLSYVPSRHIYLSYVPSRHRYLSYVPSRHRYLSYVPSRHIYLSSRLVLTCVPNKTVPLTIQAVTILPSILPNSTVTF
jgi:hypothetical protein